MTSCNTHTSMDTSKQLVSMMNDEGARLTIEGSYQDAMKIFTKNLTVVRTLLAEMQSQTSLEQEQCHPASASAKSTATTSVSSMNQDESSTSTMGVAPAGVDVVGASKANFSSDSTRQQNFVFQQLLLSSHQLNAPDSCFFETMSFTLVFNMAICQHLRLLQQEATTTEMVAREEWCKVLQLYEIAYNLQLSAKVAVPFVFVGAMLTNMAQLHKTLGNEPACQKCKSTLLSVLMYYAVEVRGSHNVRIDPLAAMMNLYFEDFFVTASAIMPADCLISAAA